MHLAPEESVSCVKSNEEFGEDDSDISTLLPAMKSVNT